MSTPQFVLPSAPDQKQAGILVKSLTKQAEGYIIKDEDAFVASWALIERHDAAIQKIGEWFNPFVEGLWKLHKMATALRAQFLDPIVESKRTLLFERNKYRTAQERAARERADFQAEVLRKQQAKELTKEAARAEKAGDVESAAVLREQAKTMPAPAVPVAPATPKQEGSVITKVWKFAVDDYAKVPEAFRLLDATKKTERELIDSKINAVVSKLGDAMPISGVRIWPETKEHSRAVR